MSGGSRWRLEGELLSGLGNKGARYCLYSVELTTCKAPFQSLLTVFLELHISRASKERNPKKGVVPFYRAAAAGHKAPRPPFFCGPAIAPDNYDDSHTDFLKLEKTKIT